MESSHARLCHGSFSSKTPIPPQALNIELEKLRHPPMPIYSDNLSVVSSLVDPSSPHVGAAWPRGPSWQMAVAAGSRIKQQTNADPTPRDGGPNRPECSTSRSSTRSPFKLIACTLDGFSEVCR